MTSITKLLVANRGEIASRVMRTAREMGIATVAVFSDPDAGAPFVADADEAVRLPGAAPAETYLRGDRIIDAALATGAGAVHPGYGFLSENAGFARACGQAGLVFVGPPPEAIEAMGSKLTAKRLMAEAGVPVLAGATIEDADSDKLAQAAGTIGFPVLVKAAFGGGGRGMRIVRSEGDLADAVASAQREAASAFGDGTVFLERYVEAPRHVEVQILGDAHGQVIHLFERECSIQRRHQKIIEESPSPAIDEELRAEMGAAAVAAGKVIGYVNAGTVEFVLDAERRFSFLEVNTRLQVEHPVTEFVTGLDLVRLQLLVAEGLALPPEATAASLSGHSIEARLYAEDVAAGFLPATGRLHRFRFPTEPGVRVDTGFVDDSTVSIHYDPMLAKVIAWAPTREEACRRLARTLERAHIHGVVTNRDLLVGILRHPEFGAGTIDTAFLERHDPARLGASPVGPDALRLHAAAAALAAQAERRANTPVLRTLPSGFRNVPGDLQRTTFQHADREISVGYRLDAPGSTVEVDGELLPDVRVLGATAEAVDLEVGGLRRTLAVHRVGDVAHVDSPFGYTALQEAERFPLPEAAAAPGSLLAPMPGGVVRVLVQVGDKVTQGIPLVVLEAMKMEHTVNAPCDGVVAEVRVGVGDQVDTGQVLAVVEDGDGND